jgi:hypothetical protein
VSLHDDDEAQVGAEDRRHDQHDEELRHHEHPLRHAHQHLVETSTPVARRGAHGDADQHGASRGGEPDEKRDARAIEHAREEVAAEVVGAEPVPAPRRLEGAGAQREGIGGSDPRPDDRDAHEEPGADEPA